jgi:predicted glycoside hydrolase/deacetylase ChbG (UPF0249 family)
MITDDKFLHELAANFPEIESELYDEDFEDNPTAQIDVFMRYTKELINRNESHMVKACFLFVDHYISNVSKKYENSLVFSYLNKMNFKQTYARNLLTKKLLTYVEELEEHSRKTFEDEEFIKKAKHIRDSQ